MIFDAERHAPLQAAAWDAGQARAMIERIAAGAEEEWQPGQGWAAHRQDSKKPDPLQGLYFGDAGVLWTLHALRARGAIELRNDYAPWLPELRGLDESEPGSYLMGEAGVLLLRQWLQPNPRTAELLEQHIADNLEHPARELMWGSPGSMLAALFLFRATGKAWWRELFLDAARQLWRQLRVDAAESCRYWTQDLYGRTSTYLDAVHGFAATASVVIAGRDLMWPSEWADWEACIAETVLRTAEWEDGLVNWRAQLTSPRGGPKLVQYCHGAPGFVICLADLPGDALDAALLAAGETTWKAGPLAKGSNLCHGTGGNGYAFLKLYRRFGDEMWLERARAFAMHGLAQTEEAHARYGRWRQSLWTGDPGFAWYLLDCIEGKDRFPTLDVFWA